MPYTIDQILTELANTAQSLLKTAQTPQIELANPKFGADYAIPCFEYAKTFRQSPQTIANQLAGELQHPAIEKTEATGGFVNCWLKPGALAQGLQKDLIEHTAYGEHQLGNGKTVIVEFPSNNIAKPFSVGHLRPATQGWAIAQLMRAMGYTVITDNHLGDWGTPFGKWVMGFLRYSSKEQLEKDGIHELARVYIQITADLKAEKEASGHELADEVQVWLLRLEQGDAQAVGYNQQFRQLSLDHMHQVLGRLGIYTDYEYGEAFYIPQAKQFVQQLVKQGIAEQQADNSIIVRLDEYGIDTPMLLQKGNGAALYATSDVMTLKFRDETWHPDKVIHFVGAEQQFHFKQLFAVAKKLGYKTEYVHYWFGLVDQLNPDGTRSKMSSRKGVVLLEDLLNMAEKKARELAPDPEALTDTAVKQIALGAIKFTDFAQDKKTAILFDWERIFNLHGYSGPYVQYAAVRVGAILAKFGEGAWQDSDYAWQDEHDLLLHLGRYPQVVRAAAETYEPHRIAQYVYDLARILNRYYETTQVGVDDQMVRNMRLWLLGLVRTNFEHALGLLGIAVPEKM